MDCIKAKDFGIDISKIPNQYVLIISKDDFYKLESNRNEVVFYVAEKVEFEEKLKNRKIYFEPTILVSRLIFNNNIFGIDKSQNKIFEKSLIWDTIFNDFSIESTCFKKIDSLYLIN
jgi:hypothetical protein